jgi:hypothetical protein
MTDLRCDSKKHGERVDDHTVEIKCSSRFCGAEPGVIVLHQFNLATGETKTRRFKQPHLKRRN